MRIIGVASIALFLVVASVFVALEELDEWAERQRHLARTRHLE